MLKKLVGSWSLKKQRGLTLVELGLAIAISAAIIVGLLVTLGTTNQSKKIMQGTQLVSELIAGAANYGSTGDTENIASKLLSAGLVSTITDPWGKDASVVYQNDQAGIVVALSGAVGDTCSTMVSQWQQTSAATADCTGGGSGNAFEVTYIMDTSSTE